MAGPRDPFIDTNDTSDLDVENSVPRTSSVAKVGPFCLEDSCLIFYLKNLALELFPSLADSSLDPSHTRSLVHRNLASPESASFPVCASGTSTNSQDDDSDIEFDKEIEELAKATPVEFKSPLLDRVTQESIAKITTLFRRMHPSISNSLSAHQLQNLTVTEALIYQSLQLQAVLQEMEKLQRLFSESFSLEQPECKLNFCST